MFGDNDDVKFADVNLQGGGPRGSGSPGSGGWPTIRYYNKETGVSGADYKKKTNEAMCDELGPKGGLLQAYIEEAGSTSLCNVDTLKGCSDKEKKFIDAMKATSAEKRDAYRVRLEGMKGQKMKQELKIWLDQRMAILTKLGSESLKSEL